MVRPFSARVAQAVRPRRAPQSAPRFRQQRYASSAPSTEEMQKKAQETLAAAQKGLGQALESGKKVLGPLGERAGSMLGSYREPVMYNFAVFREVLKHIYVAERLQFPGIAQFQSVYSQLFAQARSMEFWRGLVRSGDLTKVGIYALEAYGIFKIGEIIGRRSLIGYNVQ
ncbi:mitochondrial ATP synthase g subunit-domain-containing protein [Epithele typhae]|uniref:mitochondrial ATP synthase g subunit-domain-containing protein n=1 Tax=Epithele typhae TaxID=378194 RepID=UPI0020074EC6|nr:mitochondrial ATP synthase g subunit-domain-containing protein [Epithele typhae]KAH9937883.1 mitochondrial ATP synthase g subunit-domain-containing protein [Epithele typhae]